MKHLTKAPLSLLLLLLACGGSEPIEGVDAGGDPAFDADGDGVATALDCDDEDARLGARAMDEDCDGVPTPIDCSDTNPLIGSNENDFDCDGFATNVDCDDTTPSGNDRDCDGIPFSQDCNDTDPAEGSNLMDRDCDGIATARDCDDQDRLVGSNEDDMDCDGVPAAEDCDDARGDLGRMSFDPNCDGVQSLESSVPALGSERVDIDTEIRLVFRDPVDATTVLGNVRANFEYRTELDPDGRTVWVRPLRGRLREFQTSYEIRIDGVLNRNRQGMSPVIVNFTTTRFDEDYWYRLRDGDGADALDGRILPGYSDTPAAVSRPWDQVTPGTLWHMRGSDFSGWYLSNQAEGDGAVLDGRRDQRSGVVHSNFEARWAFVSPADAGDDLFEASPELYAMRMRSWDNFTFFDRVDQIDSTVLYGGARVSSPRRFRIYNWGPR